MFTFTSTFRVMRPQFDLDFSSIVSVFTNNNNNKHTKMSKNSWELEHMKVDGP